MIKNLSLITISIILALIGSEVILSYLGIGKYYSEERVLFYSLPSWVVDQNGAVRYEPNTKIRQVAVYGDHIDFDAAKITNNYGFFDSVQYSQTLRNKREIVFVGDSFTASSGISENWTDQLRDMLDYPDISLYNLGVSGTGVQHFHSLLKSFGSEILFNEIYIMVISNDFFRRPWYPVSTVDGIRFCQKEETKIQCIDKRPFPIAHSVGINESHAKILRRADDIYKLKYTTRKNKKPFYQKMSIYNLLCNALGSLSHETLFEDRCQHSMLNHAHRYDTNSERYQNAINTLKDISLSFPDKKIRVFHIPEKGEVFYGEYFVEMSDDLGKLGLEYIPLLKNCRWKTGMFYKNDSHPNKYGYSNLAKCVAKFM